MTRRSWAGAGGVLAVTGLLAGAAAWPLLRAFGTALPADLGDPVLETWLLWWNAATLPLTDAWWHPPMFVPMTGALALSETLLGLWPLTTPLIRAGVSPVATHNIAFVLSGPLAAVGAYALTRQLTPRRDAAWIAALAFGFSPYRIGQLSHVQVLWACWMPLALACLHAFVSTGKTRMLGGFAVCWAVNGFTNGYYLAYFPVLVGLWVFWFVRRWRDAWRIALAAVAGTLPLLPLLSAYAHHQDALGLGRTLTEIRQFSADAFAIVAASPRVWFAAPWTRPPGPEGELYPGLAVALLVTAGAAVAWRGRPSPARTGWHRVAPFSYGLAGIAAALAVLMVSTGGADLHLGPLAISAHRPSRPATVAFWLAVITTLAHPAFRRAWQRRSAFAFYSLAAATMFLLALGPEGRAGGAHLLYKPPYAWLMALPGFDAVRVPARFGALMMVCLAPAAGLGAAWLSRRVVTVGAVALILLEGWVPVPVAAMPPPLAVPAAVREAGATIIELPIDSEWAPNTRALAHQLSHGLPMVNGFGGYIPSHYHLARLGLEEGDPGVLDAFRAARTIAVFIDADRDRHGVMASLVERVTGATRLPDSVTPAGRWYLVPAGAPPTAIDGTALLATDLGAPTSDAGVETLGAIFDGDARTVWSARREGNGIDVARLTIPFRRPVSVAGVTIRLGDMTADFPRDLEIVAMTDAGRISLWRGATAGPAILGAVERPRGPIRLAWPAATEARAIELISHGAPVTAGRPQRTWSIAELGILERRR